MCTNYCKVFEYPPLSIICITSFNPPSLYGFTLFGEFLFPVQLPIATLSGKKYTAGACRIFLRIFDEDFMTSLYARSRVLRRCLYCTIGQFTNFFMKILVKILLHAFRCHGDGDYVMDLTPGADLGGG